MSNSNYNNIRFGTLARAGEGLTQWRPLVLGFVTLLVSGLLVLLSQYLMLRMGGIGGGLMSLVVAVLVFVIASSGFSAVGVMLMDKAKGLPRRSMTDALWCGLLCLPKFVGFVLLMLALVLAFLLVAAIIYFVCKIPVIGPILMFVAHPVLIVIAAVMFVAYFWVVAPLFGPAVWEGRGFKEALSIVTAVARTRLTSVVLLLLALYVVIMVIGLLVFSGLLPAVTMMSGLATAVLGEGIGLNMGSMFGLFSSSQVQAALLGSGVLFTVVFALFLQVTLLGMNLVYLAAIEGLDITSTQKALQAGLDLAKEKAREAQERARLAAERARQQMADNTASSDAATTAASASVAAAAPEGATAYTAVSAPVSMTSACPACHHNIASEDVFCGNCGHKLK